ncbi:MAG: tRNA (N6-threonylcarbamoyladenosine(37)-N6)-methyltransferase TrmO [Petrotogales bacterium]
MKKISVDLKIIGVVHPSYKTTTDALFQGKDEISEIEIDKECFEGLQDIQGFTHLHIFYWLHESTGFSLLVKTPWDSILHGVFTTRSPHRPNPIGHAVVELVERKKNILRVKGLDAIEGTPVIDIKPYVKHLDVKNNAVSGWIEKTDL